MPENKIKALVKKMTLEEKAMLVIGTGNWTTARIDRLGIPAMTVSDGPHGLRRVMESDAIVSKTYPATCFPTASCLSATWNPELAHEVGQALAEECIAQGVDVILGPGTNMKRTPLCGRNFEYFSEDPFLAGELAATLIQGIQSKGVGTSLKHFATNNQEEKRLSVSAMIDERTLREIYLPAFEKAVKVGKPWTVMCAYNRLNGTFLSEHHQLLSDILKDEWGFEGLVMSDWGAVHDRVAALSAGLDLEMPGPQPRRMQAVIAAVKSGRISESTLNDSCERILKIVFQAAKTPKGKAFDVKAHHALARKAAGEGIVLLKNTGLLPLKSPKSIAVIGDAAQAPHFEGGGSSHVTPTQVDVPFDELKKLAGKAKLTFSAGYPKDDSPAPALIDEAVAAAQAAEVAIIYACLPEIKDTEGGDRSDIDLSAQQVALIQAVSAVQPNTVVVLSNGSAVAMSAWISMVAAVVEGWLGGQAGGGAMADVLFGKVNPSGKLGETFPLRLSDTPAYLNYPGTHGEVLYGEGVYIGYRYYETKQIPVLFPFGFGGSYTTFAYNNLKVTPVSFKDTEDIKVSVDVTNTGKVAGKEIVQVYVHDRQASLRRPPKELKGFAKVSLEPGETKTVSIDLDFRAFAFWHPSYRQWITESGEFDILVGASSADIRCTEHVTLESTCRLPSILDRDSTLREWLADPHGKPVIEPMFNEMMKSMAKTFGGEAETKAALEQELSGIMDMPLTVILHFQQHTLLTAADEIVAGLLSQVYAIR